jgi:hypothetical protein
MCEGLQEGCLYGTAFDKFNYVQQTSKSSCWITSPGSLLVLFSPFTKDNVKYL